MQHALVAALEKRHAVLDRNITSMAARPGSDDLETARLKRERLLLKDRIAVARVD